jgi:hypothetical protein
VAYVLTMLNPAIPVVTMRQRLCAVALIEELFSGTLASALALIES